MQWSILFFFQHGRNDRVNNIKSSELAAKQMIHFPVFTVFLWMCCCCSFRRLTFRGYKQNRKMSLAKEKWRMGEEEMIVELQKAVFPQRLRLKNIQTLNFNSFVLPSALMVLIPCYLVYKSLSGAAVTLVISVHHVTLDCRSCRSYLFCDPNRDCLEEPNDT